MSECNSTVHSLLSGLEGMSIKQISPERLNREKIYRNRSKRTSIEFGTENEPIGDGSSRSFGANTDEEVSKIKNDNFHLQLELEQKNHEIVKLKSMLLPKLAPPAIDLKDTTNSVNSKLDPLYYYPEGRDFVTHFSSSSYEGHRDDINETSTVASTTSSNKKRNHMLFTKNILPFIRDSLQTYESSHILNDEILPIKKEFDQFYDRSLNKEERCKVLSNVLSGLVRIQRLNVAALNRELELKKIDRKMEYLATLFIDPTEFQLPQDKRLSLIKQQMLDVIIGLYGELPRMKKTSHSKAFPKEYKNQSVRAENTTKPELVPIGYMSDQKPKKRIRNIKLTPFKIASQESLDDEPDMTDPLQSLLAERMSGTDIDETNSHSIISSL